MNDWQSIAIIILVVLVSCAFMGFGAWWGFQTIEKPNRLRKLFLVLCAVYIAGAIHEIWGVLTGTVPLWSMIFLPFPVCFAWLYLRWAARITVPPKTQI